MHPLARLLAEGFTYISIDLSKGAYVTAWHKNDRRTYTASHLDPEAAVDLLIEKASADTTTKDSAPAVSSMFEDILG